MANLTVLPPVPQYEAVASGLAMLEKPVTVFSPPPIFPDGHVFALADLGSAGFLTYRVFALGGAEEVWDEDAKLWKPSAGLDVSTLKVTPFAPQDGAWQGVLVAAGKKDGAGVDVFLPTDSIYPNYFFRSRFTSMVDGAELFGLSAPSLSLRFISSQDAQLGGIRLGPGESAENATQVRLFLRNEFKIDIGWALIETVGGGTQVIIANQAGASVTMTTSGDIILSPAPGRNLQVDGPMLVETIYYHPADAAGNPVGIRKWLP